MAKGLSVLVAALLCWVCAGCGRSPEAQGPSVAEKRILKVAVFADGRITVDGSATTLEALRDSLKRLASDKGEVWYYREAGQSEPPPQAMAVMQAVVDNQLPIRLSTKPDYSDAVGVDGRAH